MSKAEDKARLRHMLDAESRAYFDIDWDIVWKTLQEDLPPLIKILKDYLQQEY